MTEKRFESDNDPPAPDDRLAKRRRLLELELIKIRGEATAARLDARAAEIELMIQRLQSPAQATETGGKAGPIKAPHFLRGTTTSFTSWAEVRQTMPVARLPTEIEPQIDDLVTPTVGHDDVRETEESDSALHNDAEPSRLIRSDASHPMPRRPHFSVQDPADSGPLRKSVDGATQFDDEISIDPQIEDDDSSPRRGRPVAWLVSAVAHVAVLLILAAVGIQSHRPKDQVAIAGSVADVHEVSIESIEIESNEPVSDHLESEPTEVQYELSPVGELEVGKITTDSDLLPPLPATASISSTSRTAAAMSLKSDSNAKIQFCGVEGGGNHFVYLVDSSQSMGDAFLSARNELLASIETLTPKQRFYVIFFDKEPDYMRLGAAQQDEQRSVYATAENKAALRHWAMQIKMDLGWAPYDPIRFALSLKPDVIFLLSDGEFPQKFEDLVHAENKVANLFGDSSPISIIHTISYFSKAGESRMRRIAEQNQGQYRHVPKP